MYSWKALQESSEGRSCCETPATRSAGRSRAWSARIDLQTKCAAPAQRESYSDPVAVGDDVKNEVTERKARVQAAKSSR